MNRFSAAPVRLVTGSSPHRRGHRNSCSDNAHGSKRSIGWVQASFSTASNTFLTGPLSRLASWYSRKLDSHPVLTKSITSGLIAGSGDFSCQLIVDKAEKEGADVALTEEASITSTQFWWWDTARTLRFTVLGVFLVAPSVHVWYGFLAKRFPLTTTQRLGPLTTRVFLDQFAFTPAFLPVWLSVLWTLEGETPALQYTNRLQDQVPKTIVANWCLWGPAQAINFALVPLKFQVLFANAVGLVWSFYLSYSTRVKPMDEEEAAVRLS